MGDVWSRCPSRGSASLHPPSLTPPALHLQLRPRGQHARAGGCSRNILHARTPPWAPTCFAKRRVGEHRQGLQTLGLGDVRGEPEAGAAVLGEPVRTGQHSRLLVSALPLASLLPLGQPEDLQASVPSAFE